MNWQHSLDELGFIHRKQISDVQAKTMLTDSYGNKVALRIYQTAETMAISNRSGSIKLSNGSFLNYSP